MSKDKVVQATKSSDNYVTVILTQKKMQAAKVLVREAGNGDIQFILPQMPEEQRHQLDGVWDRLRDDLLDVDIHQTIVSTTVRKAIDTVWAETNARIIASLLS